MQTITLFISSLLLFFQVDLSSVRAQFQAADQSKDHTVKLANSLKDYKGSDAVLLAYKGASIAMQAKFEANRKTKKTLFIDGVTLLENAVVSSPNNIEIRLIRLIMQENTPKILKYKSNITADKQLIVSQYAKQSAVVKKEISTYAKRSKLFTAAELRTITK